MLLRHPNQFQTLSTLLAWVGLFTAVASAVAEAVRSYLLPTTKGGAT